jgi:mannitol/fructose-specific phosphotransferase system IIA component (Ntr-type)
MTAHDFFGQVAERLAGRLGVGAPALHTALGDREALTSTVIGRGLAIPHVVIDGRGVFDILLARCRKGITFASEGSPVHAAFVLVGTPDERNFHLRALTAIAQIVQDPEFEARWLAARGDQALRDMVLLGKRRRDPASATG